MSENIMGTSDGISQHIHENGITHTDFLGEGEYL